VVTTTTDLRSLTERWAATGSRWSASFPPNMDAEDYQAKAAGRAAPEERAHARARRARLRPVGRSTAAASRQYGDQARRARLCRRLVRHQRCWSCADERRAGDGHAHGSGNPHYWLDPKNAEVITGTILEALSRLDPANAARYEANRAAFLAKLQSKLAEWERNWRRSRPCRWSPITTAGRTLRAASGWTSWLSSR